MQKQPAEVFYKKIHNYSQENTCVGFSSLQSCNCIKTETSAQGFSYEYGEIFKSN